MQPIRSLQCAAALLLLLSLGGAPFARLADSGDTPGLTREEYLRVHPPAPVDFAAKACDGEVVLTWSPPPEATANKSLKPTYSPIISHYIIYRKTRHTDFHKLVRTKLPRYRDKSVASGRIYTYAVTAVHEDGNESEWSPDVTVRVSGCTR